MQTTSLKSKVSRALGFTWHRMSSDGRESLEDEQSRVRLRRISTLLLATSISDALAGDGHLAVRALAERFPVGYGTVHMILTEELNISAAVYVLYKCIVLHRHYMRHCSKYFEKC